MGQIERYASSAHPFNSTLETGIRALVVLEAFYPRRCDLLELTWLDHLVVHTGDLDGRNAPESLHPALPNRAGELLVRRQLIENSLRLMQQVHLIDVFETEDGILYGASEESPSYLELLQAPYSIALKDRAKWMADHFSDMQAGEMRALIESRIGRWTADFRAEEQQAGSES